MHPNYRRWRASQSRARSPQMHHASYPVFVHRPAVSDWTSFRHRLATTPLPFSLPSALRKPGHRTCTYEVTRHARRTRKVEGRAAFGASLSNAMCTPSMGMNLWGASPLSENSTLTMLTIITTSRRQRQYREGLSEGSRNAKRRADEQKSDIRLSSRVELAHDNEGHEFALYSKSGGCVATVHVLIWGDLRRRRLRWGRAPGSNVGRVGAEVSSGHSSFEGRNALSAKDQRNRTGQRLVVLDPCVACAKREVWVGV